MNVAIIAAFVIGALLLVKRLIDSAKVDHILNQLNPDEEKAKSEAYAKEAARLSQEIKDADLRYSNAKRNLSDSNLQSNAGVSGSPGSRTEQSLPGNNQGGGSSNKKS